MATREQLIEDFADHKYATGEKFARLINSMKVVQEPVEAPAASGTSLSFIDSISQNADGKITATKKTLDLANAHELNPFKGWYKTGDTLPTDGFDGAYLYFKDTSELTGLTTIYRWNGTAYADTGTVVDTSNVQTFGSGQAVNDVKIKDENGEEVTGPAGVLSAEAGATLKNTLFTISEIGVEVEVTISNGYYKGSDGTFISGNTQRCTSKIDVVEGEKYLITTHRSSSSMAYLAQWNGETYVGKSSEFPSDADGVNDIDKPYIVPSGVNKIAVSSSNTVVPVIKKVVNVNDLKFYTKQQADNRLKEANQYGVKWNLNDPDDSGTRILDAVGLSATISVGNTQGSSDFDNIYPWSEIRRCNIKITSAGAKIVTFEGDSGFALDGTNGDVFVRIPKFCIQKYIKNGYEYRIISANVGNVHPIFIENGKVLNEVFISAFEGYLDTDNNNNNILRSIAGKIPTGGKTAAEFLNAATNNIEGSTLYDSRCVDALFNLFAVEYGCRNTTKVFGYGVADLDNPVESRHIQSYTEHSISIIPEIPTDAKRKKDLTRYAVGQVVTICYKDNVNHLFPVLLQAQITSVTDPNDYTQPLILNFAESLVVGDGIDPTTLAYGNGPDVTNYSETCGELVKVVGHTGRAAIPIVEGSGIKSNKISPMRYRWIENIFGNIWHMLPDITFNNLQMYYCKSIKDYETFSVTYPYRPYGQEYPAQIANTPNFVTELNNDEFSKHVPFGKSFVAESDTDLDEKYFGAAYYLKTGIVAIVNGGGWDHLRRCNILTNRAWLTVDDTWYLYGARLQFKQLPESQVQSDWKQTDETKVDFIKNKPTIPEPQVQSDWTETDNAKPSFIKNKPS